MTECWKQNEWERPELKSLVWALRKIYNRVSRKLRKKKSSDNLANKRDRSASLDSIGKNSTGSYTLDVVEENSIFVEHAQETSNPTKLEDQVRKLLKAKLSDDSLAKELENHYENSYSSREIRTDTATVAIDDTPHINITPETPRWPSSSFSNSYVIDDLEMNEAVDGKDEYNKKCSPVSDSAKSRISSGYSVFDLDLNNIDSELYPSRNSSGSRHVSDKGYIHPGEEPEFTPPAKHYERKIIEDKANNLNHTAASAGIADMDNSLSTVKTSTKAELTGSPGKFGTMGSKTVNSAESMTNPHQKADSSQQAIDDGNDIARYMAGTSLSRSDDESIPTQHMKVDYGIISKATYSTNADMMRSAPSTASKTRRSRNVESRDSLPSDTSQPVRNNGTTQNIIRSNDNEQMEAKHTVDDSETHGSNYKLLLQKYSEGMHGSYDTT